MNKARLAVTGVVLVALIAVGAWLFRGTDASADEPYRFGTVERGNVEDAVSATGTLNAVRSVAIGTQVSGRVIELYADYNDRVTKGQLLARIDPTIQQQQVRNSEASLERARAELDRAQREFDRNKTLFDQKVITDSEFNQVQYTLAVAQASLKQAQVNLEQARQNLAYTEIYSPIDGVVVERNAEQGQTVAASLSAPQLFLIANDLSQMEILASVDESDIGQIQPGQTVRFTVAAYPEDEFEGTVRQVRLSSTTSENVVNYTAVISVQNRDGRLLPGMTATVDFVVQRAENVLRVPNSALRLRPTPELLADLGMDSAQYAAATRPAGGPRGQNTAAVPGAQVTQAAATPDQRPAGFQGGQRPAAVGEPAPGAQRATGQVQTAGAERAPVQAAPGAAPGAQRRPSLATLYYLKDGKLSMTRVRTGITDGQFTEIVSDEIVEGTEVVTGLNQATAQAGTTNPFQQQQQGPGGPGGFGGGPPGGFGGGRP